MSSALFTIFMDDIIKECEAKVKTREIRTRNLQIVEMLVCGFADDLVVMASTEVVLQNNLKVWNTILKNCGMEINPTKTKVMMIEKEQKIIKIEINQKQLE